MTVACARQSVGPGSGPGDFFSLVRETGAHLLPNTGCHRARSHHPGPHGAQLFDPLDQLSHRRRPPPATDPFALLEAATQLTKDGFTVFPYCLDDLVSCQRLLDAGCTVLMPWGGPSAWSGPA